MLCRSLIAYAANLPDTMQVPWTAGQRSSSATASTNAERALNGPLTGGAVSCAVTRGATHQLSMWLPFSVSLHAGVALVKRPKSWLLPVRSSCSRK